LNYIALELNSSVNLMLTFAVFHDGPMMLA
jgi:hypothetical protein